MTGRMVTKGAPIQLVVLTVQLVLCSYSFSFMRRTVFFALSAAVLYELSAAVLPSPYLVKVSVLLFIYNPASAHFAAVYTESVYCFLCFWCQLCYIRGMRARQSSAIV